MSYADTGAGQPQPQDVKSQIISSLFSRRGDDGNLDETYISHVKIWEEGSAEDGGRKARYLMLAVTRYGKVVIHKAKRNTNMSFSKGKTWSLEDVQQIEVFGPQDFALTMTTRTYRWSTERSKEQLIFLNSIIKVYRTYTKGNLPRLIGIDLPENQSAARVSGHSDTGSHSGSAANNPSPIPIPANTLRPPAPRQIRHGSSSSAVSTNGSNYGTPRDVSGSGSFRGMQDNDSLAGSSYGGASAMSSIPASGRRPSDTGRATPTSSGHASLSTSHQSGARMPVRQGSGSSDIPTIPMPTRQGSTDSGRHTPSRSGSTGNVAMQYPDDTSTSRHRRPSGSRSTSGNDSTPVPMIHERPPSIPPPPKSRDRVSSGRDAPTPQPQSDDTPVINQRSQLAPLITTTQPSPSASPLLGASPPKASPLSAAGKGRRGTFIPPPVETTYSRDKLLTGRSGLLPGSVGLTIDDNADDPDGEDATMANVEEMLEGFDWTGAGRGEKGEGGARKGAADAIEGRLLDELAALEAANIHAFLESDDRITQVLGHFDEAILELDDIDNQIISYKMQLNAVSDDISYIESQNRGLQVQTSNQKALLDELQQLLQTVDVRPEELKVLAQESLENPRGIQALEEAAASLYKALQAGRDTANAEVAATIERMQEYETHSKQFCVRVLEYLSIMFKFQTETAVAEGRKAAKPTEYSIVPHEKLEENLLRYCGLLLYIKEMDEERYQKLCAGYFRAASEMHNKEMKDVLMKLIAKVNVSSGDGGDTSSFTSAAQAAARPSAVAGAMQRSRTVVGLKNESRKDRKATSTGMKPGDAFELAMTEIVNQVVREEAFSAEFLRISDTTATFADHMNLESYFRRQAARNASRGLSPATLKLGRSSLDLIFGYLVGELKDWTDAAVQKDSLSVVSLIAVSERFYREAEENQSAFFTSFFDKQLVRFRALFDRYISDQVKTIEATKLTIKKRTGVAFFVKHFSIFVDRIESQMENTDGLAIRETINSAYSKLVTAILAALQAMAKMDRADGLAAEDKGQLNYHVIMLENMHVFVEEVQVLNVEPLAPFLQQARDIYDQNLSAYIKLMLRRSFSRLMDFFDGVERLLRSTPPTEVSMHVSYNKSALKKVLKEHTAKDMRKAVDALSKRVEKHFTIDDDTASPQESAEMINAVWRACGSQLAADTEKEQSLIAKCFADTGLALDYSKADVEGAFKRR